MLFILTLVELALLIQGVGRPSPSKKSWTWRRLRTYAYSKKGIYGVRCAQKAINIAKRIGRSTPSAPPLGERKEASPYKDPKKGAPFVFIPKVLLNFNLLSIEARRPYQVSEPLDLHSLIGAEKKQSVWSRALIKAKPLTETMLPPSLPWETGKAARLRIQRTLKDRKEKIQADTYNYTPWRLKEDPVFSKEVLDYYLLKDRIPPGNLYSQKFRRKLKSFPDHLVRDYTRYLRVYTLKGEIWKGALKLSPRDVRRLAG